jgi:hypothetical protein
MNRKKVLVGLGIALVILVICAALVVFRGNILGMIRTHLGM